MIVGILVTISLISYALLSQSEAIERIAVHNVRFYDPGYQLDISNIRFQESVYTVAAFVIFTLTMFGVGLERVHSVLAELLRENQSIKRWLVTWTSIVGSVVGLFLMDTVYGGSIQKTVGMGILWKLGVVVVPRIDYLIWSGLAVGWWMYLLANTDEKVLCEDNGNSDQ